MTTRSIARVVIGVAATVLLLAPLAWMWQASRVGPAYSVMDMGYPDFGGGPVAHRMSGEDPSHSPTPGHPVAMRSVADLVVDPRRRANVVVDLVARQETVTVGGKPMPGYTLNGSSPGPTITATQGQLIEVRVRNASVNDGVALHWHGVDVPNAMDGVAGVTQDAIGVGERYVYRFLADRAGTYWYHSHQVSDPQVSGGLFGALVITPRHAPAERSLLVQAHIYGSLRTLNGQVGELEAEARPGQRVRLRVINTDNAPVRVWASHPYRLLAVDGTEVAGATPVHGLGVNVTGGARADLGLVMPRDGTAIRVQVGKDTAVVLRERGAGVGAPEEPKDDVDLLRYGTPQRPSFDPEAATRRFDYRVGYRPGFVRGRPGLWWSVNGRLYPNVPMFIVREGEVVRMRIVNSSGDVHPMHLHGHHAVVLSKNGEPATGAPWVVDTLNVPDKTTFEIAFLADNPGIWMDHCHNLKHAGEGMTAHLMYEGITTPYRIGGDHRNQPE